VNILLLLALYGGLAFLRAADHPLGFHQGVTLESFEADSLRKFPQRWKPRKDAHVAQEIYLVAEEDGNRFLRAYSEKQGIQIGLLHEFRAKSFPLLRWRWRATQLPPGGDERVEHTNDSAAAVYVIYDSRLMPRAVKYVWSTTLPVGTRATNPSYWRAKTIVLRMGAAELGTWQQETVNLYQDYKELFGAEPGEVQGIALITSSDSTGGVAAADYDDFILLPEPLSAAQGLPEAERSLPQ